MPGTSFRDRFGKALRAAREARKMTQRQVADAADIAEKYLSRIELGQASPSVDIASRLTSALRVHLDDLVDAPDRPSGVRDSPETLEIALLLRDRSAEDRDRALRVVREVLR